MNTKNKVAVLGAGLAGCCAALALSKRGFKVTIYDRNLLPMSAASLHNEGKLHLGYVYAAEPNSQTHRKMIDGSLQFLNIIEELTGIPKTFFLCSSPFVYGIPNDSMISFKEILEHFRKVDTDLEAYIGQNKSYYPTGPFYSQRLAPDEVSNVFNPKAIQGVIKTNEVSLDTTQLANVISASILSSENIDFRPESEIIRAEKKANDIISIYYSRGNEVLVKEYTTVVNSLWEDRIKIDKTVGIEPESTSFIRYKCTITFYDRRGIINDIPSSTLISGPYGDVVNYGKNKYYLSWYPIAKIGGTKSENLDELKKKVEKVNNKELILTSINELSEYIPTISQFKKVLKAGRIHGGFICAWGTSDIDDFRSGLHGRNEIGTIQNGNWVSINTGKYCTAPLFGIKAADVINKVFS